MAIVDEILVTSGDALKSQYNLFLPAGMPGGGDALTLSLRQQESFSVPESGVQTYEIFRRGQKIPKPGGAEEIDKMFTVIVRIDQNFKVYDDAKTWLDLVYNPNTGTPGQSAQVRRSVEVQNINEANVVIRRWNFENAFLGKIGAIEYDHQTQEPLTMELTFYFARMKLL